MATLAYPQDRGQPLFICSVIVPPIATTFVSARIFIRARDKNFGWDDALLLAGLVFFHAFSATAAWGAFVGLGSTNKTIVDNALSTKDIGMVLLIIAALYSAVLISVKSAVCLLLLRIAGQTRFRPWVFVIMSLTVLGFIMTEVGTMGLCSPLQANYDASYSGCVSGYNSIIVVLTALSTFISVVTDWLCALFPALILWKSTMANQEKIAAGLLMGVGALASICATMRVPYLLQYASAVSQNAAGISEPNGGTSYAFGAIILCSILECGIGLMAASIPPIRQAIRAYLKQRRDTKKPKAMGPEDGGLNLFETFLGTPPEVKQEKALRRWDVLTIKRDLDETRNWGNAMRSVIARADTDNNSQDVLIESNPHY